MRTIKHRVAWAALCCVLSGAALAGYTQFQAARFERAYPPTGHFVSFGGTARLHYTERLPAGIPKATVLLLHGATGNQADVMLPLGDRLAALGFRVLAPDRPGHGWSDRPDGEADASPARQAALIRKALEQVGVTHAIVLGHSWSGALATNFALDQADFTIGMVLVSPVTHPWPGGIAWYYAPAASPVWGPLFCHTLTMPLGMLLFEPALESVFAPKEPPPGYVDRTGAYLVLRPQEFEANAQDVAHLKNFVTAQAPRLGAIRVPTAIVTGDSDGVVLAGIHSYGSLRDIPAATLTVLGGVGHSPHWADPASVVAAVQQVFERTRQPQAAAALPSP